MPSAQLVLENLAAAKRLLDAAVSRRAPNTIESMGAAVALRDAAVVASKVARMGDAEVERFQRLLEEFDELVGHHVGPVEGGARPRA